MKTCFKCGESKPMTEFYRHPGMRDGRLGKCKKCTRQDAVSNRRRKQDYYNEYDRRRGSRQESGTIKERRLANPKKYRAQTALGNALRDGKVERGPCFMCGVDERIHGHHLDYSKPLDVVWLCCRCHRRIHAYENLKQQITGETS